MQTTASTETKTTILISDPNGAKYDTFRGSVAIWRDSGGQVSVVELCPLYQQRVDFDAAWADALMHVLADALGYSVVKIEGE